MKLYNYYLKLLPISIGLCFSISYSQEEIVPLSTRWMLEDAGTFGNENIRFSYRVICPKTKNSGSGFLLNSGYVITNSHVIQDNAPEDIFLISSLGNKTSAEKIYRDTLIDLVIIKPRDTLQGGLKIQKESKPVIGEFVFTFGYPSGYLGPSPILTTGYVAGYKAFQDTTSKKIIKHFIVNGAFNPGNSGGAVISSKSNEVIGIVVSKHAPIDKESKKIIDFYLENDEYGMFWNWMDEEGNETNIAETQLTGKVLNYYREMIQFVLGEAILVEDLIKMLEEHNLSY